MGKRVTFRAVSLRHLVFSESFESEIYSMFKQIFLLNAQFTIVYFDVTLGGKICRILVTFMHYGCFSTISTIIPIIFTWEFPPPPPPRACRINFKHS